jgi:hypothetical protein
MRSRRSIRKRGKRSYEIKYETERGLDGKRQTKWLTIRGSRQDAQKQLAALLVSLDANAYVDPSALTLGQFLTAWLVDQHHLGTKTRERRAGLIANLPALTVVPS